MADTLVKNLPSARAQAEQRRRLNGDAAQLAEASKQVAASPVDAVLNMMTNTTSSGQITLQAIASILVAQPPEVLAALVANFRNGTTGSQNVSTIAGLPRSETNSSDATAMANLLAAAGVGMSLRHDKNSTVTHNSLNANVLGDASATGGNRGSAASSVAAQCYRVAGATATIGQLNFQSMPEWSELLSALSTVGGAVVGSGIAHIKQGSNMQSTGTLIDTGASMLSKIWPDFRHAWEAHLHQVGSDLATLTSGATRASSHDSSSHIGSIGRSPPPPSPPPPKLKGRENLHLPKGQGVPKHRVLRGAHSLLSATVAATVRHPDYDEVSHDAVASLIARRRLARTPRGRQLLSLIDESPDGSGHAEATRQLEQMLSLHRYHVGSVDQAEVGHSHKDHEPYQRAVHIAGGVSLAASASEDASLVAGGLAGFTWEGYIMSVALLAVGGQAAPAAAVLSFKGGSSLADGEVATVEQTAPVVGNGLDRGHADGGGLSCDAFGYLHHPSPTPQPEQPSIFQPSTLAAFNWLLDAGVRPDGSRRTYCPPLEEHLAGAGGTNEVNSTVIGPDGGRYLPPGRSGITPLIFNDRADAAAAANIGGHSSERSRAMQAAILATCPSDPVSLMRTEIAPLCQESYLASEQRAPFTDPDVTGFASMGLHPERQVPQLVVRDRKGRPLAGKTCVIRDVGRGSDYFGLFDTKPFKIDYTCGPSDSSGIITIENFSMSGGSTREVVLEISVDGVLAAPISNAAWRFDSRLFYVSAESPSFSHLGVLLSGGHSSVHLFVLLSLLAMSVNAISINHGKYRPAPVYFRLLGLSSLLGLVYTASAMYTRHFTSDSTESVLSTLGLRDLVATRTSSLSFESWILATLTVLLSLAIVVIVSWLFLIDQRIALRKAWLKVQYDYLGRTIRKTKAAVKRSPAASQAVSYLSKARKGCAYVLCTPCIGYRNIRDMQCWKGEHRVGRFLKKWLPVGPWFGAVTKALTKPPIEYDGELEPPPTALFWPFGVVVHGWFEPRAQQRARCARNYVRRLLRGRRWLHAQLLVEQERINERNRGFFRRCLVVTLQLPTRVHPHLPLEREGDFFYPERLLLACCLSVWLQLLFSMGLVAFGRYLHSLLLGAAHTLAQLDAMAQAHVQLESPHGSSNLAVTPLSAMLITGAANLYQLTGASTSIQGVTDAITVHLAAGLHRLTWAAGCVSFIYHLVAWRGIFHRYRTRIYQMRTGRYFFDRSVMAETGGSSYIGYQAAFMIASTGVVLTGVFFVFALTYGLSVIVTQYTQSKAAAEGTDAEAPRQQHVVALDLMYPPPPPSATSAYGDYLESISMRVGSYPISPYVWSLVVAYVFQLVFNKLVWFTSATRFRGGHIGNRWLRFRFWYSIYEYLLVLPNVAIGLVLLLLRMLAALLMWIYHTFSIDISLIPAGRGTERWDVGYVSYVAMVRTDHRYSNPIVMTFLSIVQRQLAEKRLESARIKLRRQLQKNIERRKGSYPGSLGTGHDSKDDGDDSQPDANGVSPHAATSGTPGDDEARDEFKTPPQTDGVQSDSPAPGKLVSYDIEGGVWRSVDDLGEPLTSSTAIVEALKRRRRATRRWQLALMLLQNPPLICYRKMHLTTEGLTEEEANLNAALRETFVEPLLPLISVPGKMVDELPEDVKHVPNKIGEGVGKIGEGIGEMGHTARAQLVANGRMAGHAMNKAGEGLQNAFKNATSGFVRDADGNFISKSDAAEGKPAWSQIKVPELPPVRMPEFPDFNRKLAEAAVAMPTMPDLRIRVPRFPEVRMPEVRMPSLPSLPPLPSLPRMPWAKNEEELKRERDDALLRDYYMRRTFGTDATEGAEAFAPPATPPPATPPSAEPPVPKPGLTAHTAAIEQETLDDSALGTLMPIAPGKMPGSMPAAARDPGPPNFVNPSPFEPPAPGEKGP